MAPHVSRPNECRLCGGTLVPALRDVLDSTSGERFGIDRCSRCGVAQTNPFPDDLAPYYASYHGNRHGLTGRYRFARRLRLVRRSVASGRGRRLLDMGCGDGSFLLAAAKAGWQVFGTELKPDVPRAAGLDVRTAIDQFDVGEPFDCVTFWHSLEHLSDPRAALAQAHDRLRPGGLVFIAVPDNGGWQARLCGRHWLHLDVPRHLFHFDRSSLARLLATTGLRPIREWHLELEYDLLGWSQSALNVIGLQRNLFFSLLMGKTVRARKPVQLAHMAMGFLLTGAALPLVALGSLCRRGGTLVTAARREP